MSLERKPWRVTGIFSSVCQKIRLLKQSFLRRKTNGKQLLCNLENLFCFCVNFVRIVIN